MKKIFSSAITGIVIFLGVLILFLYSCGFRITYSPTLENSWDAISAFASWFSAIASIVAIFIAIRIPKKIAEQQNAIALFDKRYKAYDTLMFLTSAVSKMADGTVNEMKKAYLDTIIETYKSISMVGVETLNCKEYSNMYVSLIFEAGKSVNIFNLKKDENKKITTFLIAVHEYVLSVYANKITNDTELKTAYNQLVELHLEEKMEKQIKIK